MTAATARWQEWASFVLGLWLVMAPFVLGFSSATLPTANSVAVGTLVMVLAGSALSLDKEIGKWWHKRVAGH